MSKLLATIQNNTIIIGSPEYIKLIKDGKIIIFNKDKKDD